MTRKPKILIIEDESITAETIKEQLESMGYEVCAIGVSGEEAVELTRAHCPDLIIMDIKLKGDEDGITAALKIHDSIDVPVIFLTANSDKTTFNRAKLSGPDGFISKPYTPVDLANNIEIVLNRRQMELKLRESELRYRRLVEDMPHLICRFNSEGTLTFVNNAFCAYFDRCREELIGASFLDFIPGKEHGFMLRSIRSLTTDNPIISNEYQVTLPDGSVRWQRWTNRALFDHTVTIQEYQAVGEDITKFRFLEEEVIKIAEEERRNISQNLHDDLGQKLSYMGFLAEMMKKSMSGGSAEDRDRIDSMIHLIHDAIEHVRGIARGLQPVSLEPDGFINSVEHHVAEMSRLLGVKINFQKEGNILIKDAFTAVYLYHIVKELITNAAKHGSRSGITLRIRNTGTEIQIVMKNRIGNRSNLENMDSIGLIIMRHRANLIGAKIEVFITKDSFRTELTL